MSTRRSFLQLLAAIPAAIGIAKSADPALEAAERLLDNLERTPLPGEWLEMRLVPGNEPAIVTGHGSPHGLVKAPLGSIWLQNDEPGFYRNTDGKTSWSRI